MLRMTGQVRDEARLRAGLELELALRGFLLTSGDPSRPVWQRQSPPHVAVSIDGTSAVLDCDGIGSASVDAAAGVSEILRTVDDWTTRLSGNDDAERRARHDPEPVTAGVLEPEASEDLPVTSGALPVLARDEDPRVPEELWRLLSTQFDQVRELSEQLLLARERAVRAEVEVGFLRSQLRELEACEPAGRQPALTSRRFWSGVKEFLRLRFRPVGPV